MFFPKDDMKTYGDPGSLEQNLAPESKILGGKQQNAGKKGGQRAKCWLGAEGQILRDRKRPFFGRLKHFVFEEPAQISHFMIFWSLWGPPPCSGQGIHQWICKPSTRDNPRQPETSETLKPSTPLSLSLLLQPTLAVTDSWTDGTTSLS